MLLLQLCCRGVWVFACMLPTPSVRMRVYAYMMVLHAATLGVCLCV